MIDRILKRFGYLPEGTEVKIIRKSETTLRLQDWQANPELIKVGRRVMANPDFQMMISVLRNEHPGHVVISDDAPPTRSVAIQRRGEGYTMALANLEAMGKLIEPEKPFEATFENEEQQL